MRVLCSQLPRLALDVSTTVRVTIKGEKHQPQTGNGRGVITIFITVENFLVVCWTRWNKDRISAFGWICTIIKLEDRWIVSIELITTILTRRLVDFGIVHGPDTSSVWCVIFWWIKTTLCTKFAWYRVLLVCWHLSVEKVCLMFGKTHRKCGILTKWPPLLSLY